MNTAPEFDDVKITILSFVTSNKIGSSCGEAPNADDFVQLR